MLGVSLAQVNEVDPVPEKLIFVVAAPLQTVWLAGWLTEGGGLTVMVRLLVGPVQSTPRLRKWGVTVTVAATAVVPPLVTVKAGMSPVPLAASPMVVLLLTQVKEVPVPEKLIFVVAPPLQTVWLAG